MAFSDNRVEETLNSNSWLLDKSLMQSMQDRFCDANNVYMVCLSIQNGVITKAYGTNEELKYIHSIADMDMHASLLKKMVGNSIESVVEEPQKSGFVERFLELSLFYGLSSPLNSEMICIFPYF